MIQKDRFLRTIFHFEGDDGENAGGHGIAVYGGWTDRLGSQQKFLYYLRKSSDSDSKGNV